MRFAAQRTISMQDNNPADGTVYMADLHNHSTSMMRALRDWEKRRGLSMTFKATFGNSKKFTTPKEVPKEKEKIVRQKPVRVKRTKLTPEQIKERKREYNRKARERNPELWRQRSRDFRAKASPEQKALSLQRVREYRERQKAAKAAAKHAGGSGQVGVPLADDSAA